MTATLAVPCRAPKWHPFDCGCDHQRRAAARLIDLAPCLICGAPIDRNGYGHDDGCMGLDS